MRVIYSVSDLPQVPAVYAMCSQQGTGMVVAYVGDAPKLKPKLMQHFLRRDSTLTAASSVVALNPDYVTEVWWWEHPAFADNARLQAGEAVAVEVHGPVLRNRGTSEQAQLHLMEGGFREEMRQLFSGQPTGRLVIRTLREAWERIDELEKRVAELERVLRRAQK